MIYMPSFIKIGSDTKKPMGGTQIHGHTDRMEITYAYFLFFQNKESGLTM
jgi:hypothetical protein